MRITLAHYLIVSGLLFSIGILGSLFRKRSLLNLLICLELLLLAVIISFTTFSYYLNDLTGQIFSLFILTVAAAEAAIGLALILLYQRHKNTLLVAELNELKG